MTPPKATMANNMKRDWVKRTRILLADLIAGKYVDQTRLHKIAEEIDDATTKYQTVPITSLSAKDVQTTLCLKPLRSEDEFKRIPPINPPKAMSTKSRDWTSVTDLTFYRCTPQTDSSGLRSISHN